MSTTITAIQYDEEYKTALRIAHLHYKRFRLFVSSTEGIRCPACFKMHADPLFSANSAMSCLECKTEFDVTYHANSKTKSIGIIKLTNKYDYLIEQFELDTIKRD